MPYTAEITTANPTCFLFLVDESRSMREQMTDGSGKTRAEAADDAINRLMKALSLRCAKGPAAVDCFHVGMLGYEEMVTSTSAGYFAGRRSDADQRGGCQSRAAQTSLLRRERLPGQGRRADVRRPEAGEGRPGSIPSGAPKLLPAPGHSPCRRARQRRRSGRPGRRAALPLQQRRQRLALPRASGAEGRGTLFPDAEDLLADPFARQLFRMSSVLPPPRAAAGPVASRSGAARAFVSYANLDAVVGFLAIDTTVSRMAAPMSSPCLPSPPSPVPSMPTSKSKSILNSPDLPTLPFPPPPPRPRRDAGERAMGETPQQPRKEEKPRDLREAQFTIYRPKTVQPDIWYPMLAFTHLAECRPDAPAKEPDPIEQVRASQAGARGPDSTVPRHLRGRPPGCAARGRNHSLARRPRHRVQSRTADLPLDGRRPPRGVPPSRRRRPRRHDGARPAVGLSRRDSAGRGGPGCQGRFHAPDDGPRRGDPGRHGPAVPQDLRVVLAQGCRDRSSV